MPSYEEIGVYVKTKQCSDVALCKKSAIEFTVFFTIFSTILQFNGQYEGKREEFLAWKVPLIRNHTGKEAKGNKNQLFQVTIKFPLAIYFF